MAGGVVSGPSWGWCWWTGSTGRREEDGGQHSYGAGADLGTGVAGFGVDDLDEVGGG